MPVKASWARNSAVTSTTVEAVASDQETPCNVTARAPNTKPPTWENGRQLAEQSRTMRPQTNTQGRRASRGGMIASQASPSTVNSTSCQPMMSAKSPQPTRQHAGDRPGRSRTSRSARWQAKGPARASRIESFFNAGPSCWPRWRAAGSTPNPPPRAIHRRRDPGRYIAVGTQGDTSPSGHRRRAGGLQR